MTAARPHWLPPAQERIERRALDLVESAEARRVIADAKADFLRLWPLAHHQRRLIDAEFAQIAFASALVVVNSDVDTPSFHAAGRLPHRLGDADVPGSALYHGNPACIYRVAPVAPGASYRLIGRFVTARPTATDISLIDVDQVFLQTVGSSTLRVGDDGAFELLIGSEGRGAAAMAGHERAYQIYVRDIVADPDVQQPPALDLVRISEQPSARTGRSLREPFRTVMLRTVAEIVALNQRVWSQPVNTLVPPAPTSPIVFLPTQPISMGHFALDRNTGLLLTIEDGGFAAVLASATNHFGGATGFPARPALYVANAADRPGRGAATVLLALEDPGVRPWIDAGTPEGMLIVRWVGAPTKPHARAPNVTCRVVPLRDAARLIVEADPGARAEDQRAAEQAFLKGFMRLKG